MLNSLENKININNIIEKIKYNHNIDNTKKSLIFEPINEKKENYPLPIPINFQKVYSYHNVNFLYPWQYHAIIFGKENSNENFIYTAPTSGGKTMVAELLAITRLKEKFGRIIYIVPYVSLVTEKTSYFRKLLSSKLLPKEDVYKVNGYQGKNVFYYIYDRENLKVKHFQFVQLKKQIN